MPPSTSPSVPTLQEAAVLAQPQAAVTSLAITPHISVSALVAIRSEGLRVGESRSLSVSRERPDYKWEARVPLVHALVPSDSATRRSLRSLVGAEVLGAATVYKVSAAPSSKLFWAEFR